MKRALAILIVGGTALFLFAYPTAHDAPGEAGRAPASEAPRTRSEPAAKAQTAPSASSAPAARAEIDRLEACFATEKCAFPQTDPRSYHFAVSAALAAEIGAYQEKFGPSPEVALAAMRIPEPTVQAAALTMITALPPSPESLAAMREGLKNTPDPSLVEQAVRELERYLGTPWEREAQRIVGELVADGAHFSAQQAATMILPFVNEYSLPEFRRLLARMPLGSQAAIDLRAALSEYERQRSGG